MDFLILSYFASYYFLLALALFWLLFTMNMKFVHPRSRIRIFSIPDPDRGQKKAPDPGSTGTVLIKISVKDPDLRLFEHGKFFSLLGRIRI